MAGLRIPPPSRLDVVLALATTLAVSAAIAAHVEVEARDPDVAAYGLAVLMGGVLLVRRRWPLGVTFATITTMVVYYRSAYPAIGLAVPLSGALFSLAEAGRLRWALSLSTGLLGFTTLFRLFAQRDEDRSVLLGYDVISNVALFVAVLSLGEAVRARRVWRSELDRREQQAQAERELETARRVDEERVRIARDIHDVLAHTVSVISIQSAVATEALDDDPDAVRASLAAIRTASGEALSELRTTVGLLRSEAGRGYSLAPAPGLADLDRLVAKASEAGLNACVRVEGEPRPLSPVVDLTAHRILQESITNVLRHSGAATATIALCYDLDAVTLSVTDSGRGGEVNGHGFGIRGMRERAAAVGGRVDAGLGPAGGFRVTAYLPCERPTA